MLQGTAFPAEKHDLVVCIEVLEHIEESRAEIAIKNLSSLVADGGTIVFSSAAADVIGTDDVFHINAQSEDYWLTLFKENGFVKADFDLSFICPWAIALRK
jgi:2-polyprenyl-3-methyl-5-hydroxy-6-metoxy-1,4-benzoquinol methylase